jgi:protein-disulfide isomerase/uncharacterized membrane protein
MENNKTLTTNGLTLPHVAYIIISLAMIGVSAYLTNHFYESYFPKGFGSPDSLCDINSFWGCDKATKSIFGHIFYVPTSFFGIIIGLLGLIGAIFPSEQMEKTNKFFIFLNAIGCLVLFLFSLIALSGLCPFCTVYYLLSWVAAFLFYKYSELKCVPEVKITAFYGVLVIIPSIFMYNHFTTKEKQQQSLSTQYIEQYKNLASAGDPTIESPFKIHMSSDKFDNAPLRISIFSDFECPFCKVVSDQIHEIIEPFKDKINVQYFFYPLDNACNTKITRVFHRYACMAAELAACSGDKFPEVHDMIFARQKELSTDNLQKWEKELGLKDCFTTQTYKDQIQETLAAAEQFGLKSTPTMIINGKKIEGTIPTVHFKAILQSILDKK